MDFQLYNIKDIHNKKYTFYLDIKYSTDNDFDIKQLTGGWIDAFKNQEEEQNKSIYFFYLVFSPNFNYQVKKSNLISWNLELKDWKK